MSDPFDLPDLAVRTQGGAVVAANDEFFAGKENLIRPEPPRARDDFGARGKEYDGWETRRRRRGWPGCRGRARSRSGRTSTWWPSRPTSRSPWAGSSTATR